MGITYTRMAAYNRANRYNDQSRLKSTIQERSRNVNIVRNVKEFSKYWGVGLAHKNPKHATYRRGSGGKSSSSGPYQHKL